MSPIRLKRVQPVITRNRRGMSRPSENTGRGPVPQQLGTAACPEGPLQGPGEIDSVSVRRPGPASAPLGPVRTCVGCRARTSADELLRVIAVDGAVVPDPRRRLAGRGAWLHRSEDCLRLAERRKAFPRALRVQGPLTVEQLADHLAQVVGGKNAVGRTRGEQEQGSRSTRHESAVKLKP
ncbi:MAG TPA: YlxR family protein [Pseudonocardiaceae bacterium]|nr:YlxR family protein [Pseudonocardiaceae bacterium]